MSKGIYAVYIEQQLKNSKTYPYTGCVLAKDNKDAGERAIAMLGIPRDDIKSVRCVLTETRELELFPYEYVRYSPKITIIQTDGWHSIYINSKIHDQGEVLGEGDSTLYLLRLASKFNFSIKDVKVFELDSLDEKYINDNGRFPNKLTDLNGNYSHTKKTIK